MIRQFFGWTILMLADAFVAVGERLLLVAGALLKIRPRR